MNDKNIFDKRITIRLSNSDYDILTAKAKEKNISKSEYARLLLCQTNTKCQTEKTIKRQTNNNSVLKDIYGVLNTKIRKGSMIQENITLNNIIEKALKIIKDNIK